MPKLQLIEEPWWGRESRISLVTEGVIHATTEDVFDVLADHRQWSAWYPGMITVELTGRTSGVGVERQVRIGRTRIIQQFTVWEPNHRLTLCHVRSTAPGMAAVVEDWELIEHGDGTLVKYVVGAEPRVAARGLTAVFRARMRAATGGAVDALRERVELILAEGPVGSIALLAGDVTGGLAIPPTNTPLGQRLAEEESARDDAAADDASDGTAIPDPFDTGDDADTDDDADETLHTAGTPGAIFTDEAFSPAPDATPDDDTEASSETADTSDVDDELGSNPLDDDQDAAEEHDDPAPTTTRRGKNSKPIAL